jgi:hypothetical protein
MATMTNILVKDDATTPVEYTFVPISDNPDPLWRTAIAGVPLDGQMRLTASSRKQKNGSFKITCKLEVPVMETLGASGTSSGYVAPPKTAYVNTGIFTMFVDKRSTIADRANVLKMIAAFMCGNAAATNAGMSPITATGDSFKNSAQPMPLMVTNLITPS